MAHADYECCAVCDSKMAYASNASPKTEICSCCVAELAVREVIVHNVAELERWIINTGGEKVKEVLEGVNFRFCIYGSWIDDKAKEKGVAPTTPKLEKEGE